MMINVEEIMRELMRIDANVSECSRWLQSERKELSIARDKVQSEFGDQTSGRSLAMALDEAANHVYAADSILHVLKHELNICTQGLKK